MRLFILLALSLGGGRAFTTPPPQLKHSPSTCCTYPSSVQHDVRPGPQLLAFPFSRPLLDLAYPRGRPHRGSANSQRRRWCGAMGLAASSYEAPLRSLLQLVVEPQSTSSWYDMGMLLQDRGRLVAAVVCLQRASNLCSASNSTVLTDLGHTLRATGQFQKASDAYRASVALGGELKGAGGASKQALTYFRAASGLVPSAPSSRVVGEADSEALRASMPKDMHRALSQVHMTDVASEAECGMLIALAEAAAAVRGGWTSEGHHKDFPTRDVVVSEVPEMAVWLNAALEAKIWPSLAAQFGVEASDLWLQDCFLVRYDGDGSGQRGLGEHVDDSELSFNLLLSSPADFEGGGTRFPSLDGGSGQTLRPGKGQMLSHFGRLRHQGVPLTSGTRYILAGFVRVRPLAEMWQSMAGLAG